MNNGLIKALCISSALALVVAFGTPQGKRGGGTATAGTTGSSGSSGGRSSGGSGTTTTGGRTSGGNTGGTTTGGRNTGGGSGGGTIGGNSGGGTTGGTIGGGTGGRRQEPPPTRTTTGGGGGGGGGTTGGRNDDRRGTTGGGVITTTTGGGIDRGRDTGRTVISGPGQGQPGRRGDSRSGDVRYGTTNNQIDVRVGNVRITRPAGVINPGMQRRVNDQERVGLVYNGWRVGYHHYDNRWRDDYFRYPFYLFNPWDANRYVCSPWYYYPTCPPYLNSTRIIIINSGWPSYNWNAPNYRWNRPDWSNRSGRYEDIDYAIEDIVNAFERYDYRAVDRLVPRGGNVHMYFDGRYGYSLDSRDFYDLYVDGIENVRTTRYDILNVQYNGRGARVLAKHEFTSPWGQREYTYHQYFLEQDRRDWVIREFGTSSQRPW